MRSTRSPFDSVNGQARPGLAAVDVASGTVLAWQPTGVAVFSLDFADNGWIYVTASGGTFPRRRVDAATGTVDPVWQPTDVLSLQLVGGELMTWGRITSGGCNTGTVLGTLDPVTGAYREWFRTSGFNSARVTRDGDTVYIAGALPNFQPGGCGVGSALFAYDRRTGVRVAAPPLVGAINSLGMVDGRLFAAGGAMAMGAAPVNGLVELLRPSGTALAQSGVFAATAHGDLLVGLAGNAASASGFMRVVGFGSTGTSVPSNLRSHAAGADTVFTWDPMASPPAGGYVIEGGFAAGQSAAALPVGNATSIALPMPAGPVFIRVRPQGSTEVSNEIVAGCVAPPLPPTALTTTLVGTMLTLAWTSPAAAVTSYTLVAGTAAGLSNVVTLPLGPQTSVSGTVPGGTFFTRVTASNACGTSGPSGEVFFTIGAPDALPAAPTALTSSVSGSTLTLSWTAPAGPVSGYMLEAGSAPGLANIGAATVGAATSFIIPGVPAGAYYVRVRAVSSAGSGAPSQDVLIAIP